MGVVLSVSLTITLSFTLTTGAAISGTVVDGGMLLENSLRFKKPPGPAGGFPILLSGSLEMLFSGSLTMLLSAKETALLVTFRHLFLIPSTPDFGRSEKLLLDEVLGSPDGDLYRLGKAVDGF